MTTLLFRSGHGSLSLRPSELFRQRYAFRDFPSDGLVEGGAGEGEGRFNAVNPTKQSHIDRDLMDRPPRRQTGVAKGGSHAAWMEVADDDAAAKRSESGIRKRGKLQEAVAAGGKNKQVRPHLHSRRR